MVCGDSKEWKMTGIEAMGEVKASWLLVAETHLMHEKWLWCVLGSFLQGNGHYNISTSQAACKSPRRGIIH